MSAENGKKVISTAQRKKDADEITKRRTIYAAGAGLIPFPLLDVATLLGVQVVMIRDIARVYGQEDNFKKTQVKSFISTLVGDLATVGVVSGVKALPIVGSIVGMATAPITGATATYALGKVFTHHFDQGGTLLNFDPVKSRKYFKQAEEEGTIFVEEVAPTSDEISAAELPGDIDQLKEMEKEVEEKLKGIQSKIREAQSFTVVEGIGPVMEKVLRNAGIDSIKTLSETSVTKLRSILKDAGAKYNSFDPATWPKQAKLAVEGKTDELEALQDELVGGKKV